MRLTRSQLKTKNHPGADNIAVRPERIEAASRNERPILPEINTDRIAYPRNGFPALKDPIFRFTP